MHNDSMRAGGGLNARKDSMASSAASEIKRNPMEDMIIQKSNQMMLQQLEATYKQ